MTMHVCYLFEKREKLNDKFSSFIQSVKSSGLAMKASLTDKTVEVEGDTKYFFKLAGEEIRGHQFDSIIDEFKDIEEKL